MTDQNDTPTNGMEQAEGKELRITVGQWRLGVYVARSVDAGSEQGDE